MYSGGVSLPAGLDGGNTMIFAAGKNATYPIIHSFAEGLMGADEMQRVILSQTFLLIFDMMSPLKFL